MSNFAKTLLVAAGTLVILLCQGRSTSAQCSYGTLQYGNVSLQKGNPFEAEYSATMPPPLAGMALAAPPRLHSVARDSEGRVREERVAGKFKVKTAAGAESEQEQHLITICDPISQKLIRLDTLNKTATVQGSRLGISRPGLPLLPASQTFCSRYFKMYRSSTHFRSEDLGSQIISGVVAEGVRTWIVLEAPNSGIIQSQLNYQDHWCSEELGAFVMQAYGNPQTGRRNETVLKNIERKETDATLFQIPADYTIEEHADDSSLRPELRRREISPAPNSPQ